MLKRILLATVLSFIILSCNYVISTNTFLLPSNNDIPAESQINTISDTNTYDAFINDESNSLDESLNEAEQDNVQVNDIIYSNQSAKSIGDGNTVYYFPMLDYDKKMVYESIYDGLVNLEETIVVPSNLNEKELMDCFQFILNDHPEIFWVDGQYSYTVDENGIVYNFSPIYTGSFDEIEQQKEIIESSAREILPRIDMNADINNKAKQIYEAVAEYMSYDVEVENSQNLQSALIDKVTSCAGYSKTFQYICSLVGIDCIYITGPSSVADEEAVLHAWNAIRINNEQEYVYVDVTWGDRDNERPLDWTWYGLCLDDIKTNHEFQYETAILQNTSRFYDVWSNGTYYIEYNYDVIINQLKESISNKEQQTYLRFDNEQSYQEVVSNLIESNDIVNTLAEEYQDVFSDPVVNGVYSVYKNDKLNAINIVWLY